MNARRASLLSSFTVLAMALATTVGFVLLAVLGGPDIQRVLLRVVAVSLIIFLVVLFTRYFALLWFAYLGHAERNVSRPAPMGELPPISILVPAYNEGEVLDEALQSLSRLDYPRYEVIVVDDGSRDDTLAVAAAWEGERGPVEFRAVTQPNAGKATALNTGIRVSKHPFVFCMDADSQLEPQTLREAVRHMAQDSVGAVAGNVKVRNRGNFLARLQALEYIEGLNLPRRAQGFVAAVNIVPGPVGLFRREALEEVGAYDTDTFAEDADLTLKLMAAGWKVVYEDRAVAWTDAPERWVDLAQQRYRWTRGILQTLRKRKGVLARPFPDFPLWISALQMGFEAVLWPVLNIYAHLFFALIAILFGSGELILYWLVLLSLLDLVAALVTVSMEEESLGLVPLALIYRFVFVLFLDVVKALASLEEFFRLDMGWGKLDRSHAT
ncbi:MAG TPA: glycosyltransferase family 2 protein [Longimicrobiales bacterium]|nr:glycosyltransferase family 2 protein [Longimicrobiales bacterium]